MLNLFMPIDSKSDVEKSERSEDKGWYVSGFASTPDKDFQGERIDPMGINYTDYFLKNGWLNYEHKHEIEDVIGEPTKVNTSEKGLYIEGKLYKSIPKAKDVWNLQKALANESDSNRRLGFSIEGKVLERDPTDETFIRKVLLSNVAITFHPANPHAKLEAYAKSYELGYETDPEKMKGASALKRNPVSDAIAVLSYTASRRNADDMLKEAEQELRDTGMLSKNTLSLILQVGRGMSKEDACHIVDKFNNN